MKKNLLLLLVFILGGCRDNTIYHEYQNIRGVWDVVSISPKTSASLSFIHLSCDPSKKISDNENQSCIGNINASKGENSKLLMNYKIKSPKEIVVRYITDKFQGNMNEQDYKIKDLLVGTWTYTLRNDTLIWTSDKEIIFKKRKE